MAVELPSLDTQAHQQGHCHGLHQASDCMPDKTPVMGETVHRADKEVTLLASSIVQRKYLNCQLSRPNSFMTSYLALHYVYTAGK